MNPMEYVSPEPYKLYINGQYVAAEKGNIVDVIKPCQQPTLCQGLPGHQRGLRKSHSGRPQGI